MIQSLSPKHVKEVIDSGKKIRLIDVREEWEYEIARLPGSELMPMSRFTKLAPLLDQEEKLVVYCHKGVRSLRVCSYLFNAGFKDIINLEGGINAWSEEIDNEIPKY